MLLLLFLIFLSLTEEEVFIPEFLFISLYTYMWSILELYFDLLILLVSSGCPGIIAIGDLLSLGTMVLYSSMSWNGVILLFLDLAIKGSIDANELS